MKQIEWSKLELKIDQLSQTTPAPGKHSARNAMLHLKKAWKLVKDDPEMAVLRGITAEEESATAVFHTLRRRKYDLSNQLNPYNHMHKHALSQFCNAVLSLFKEMNDNLKINPNLVLNEENKQPYLEIKFDMSTIMPNNPPDKRYMTPIPPLDVSIFSDGTTYNFSRELDKLAGAKNTKSIYDYIKKRANVRNQILYASSAGIPSPNNTEAFLKAQRVIINNNLLLYLLIDPHKEKQRLVQQSLYAFLKMVGKLKDDIDFR